MNYTMTNRGQEVFSQLPDEIRVKVLALLQNDNFPAAKALYDAWRSEQERRHK